jgi:hypothetical protein
VHQVVLCVATIVVPREEHGVQHVGLPVVSSTKTTLG